MASIEEKRKQRFQFLHLVYERTNGNASTDVNKNDIGKELGWDTETTTSVTRYLKGEGLIKQFTIGGAIYLTHEGVKEVELALEKPTESTTYFPPTINIITGNSFNNSIVNISSSLENLSQSIGEISNVDEGQKEELQQLLNELKQELEQIPDNHIEDAEAIVWTAENLIEEKTSENPNKTKIQISKEGLKKAAENLASVLPKVLPIALRISETIEAMGNSK